MAVDKALKKENSTLAWKKLKSFRELSSNGSHNSREHCKEPSPSSFFSAVCLFFQMESYNFLYVNTLVQDYLKYICQEAQLAAAPNRVAELLRKAGSSAQKEVESNLRPYVDSLEIHSVEEANDIFNQVMENEFADGIINWGRILTIFLFGGILAKKLQGPLAKENLKQISYFITDYIMGTKGKWISDNGGWDNGFITKFEDKSSWISLSTLKTKLLAVFSLFNQYPS